MLGTERPDCTAPPERYVLLNAGDVIREGDEYWDRKYGWQLTKRFGSINDEICIYRRRADLAPAPAGVTQGVAVPSWITMNITGECSDAREAACVLRVIADQIDGKPNAMLDDITGRCTIICDIKLRGGK